MTDWDRLARPSLAGLTRYDPGRSRDEIRAAHGLATLEPLHWNEDRFGPPAEALAAAAAELERAPLYPERAYSDFRDAVAERLGVPPAHVVPAHGAQALIGSIAAAFVERGTPVVVPAPTYGLYAHVSAAAGGAVTRVPADGLGFDLARIGAAAADAHARVVWLCDPNNPTGALLEPDAWSAFLDALPRDCVVVADEAYMDFADPAAAARRVDDVVAGRPVIVVRSFSKLYGLAGLRLGYAVADPAVARLLDLVQEPFNVNRVALAAGRAALAVPGFADRRRAEVAAARAVLAEALAAGGVVAHPSQANFVLAEPGGDDLALRDRLLGDGILVRAGQEFGLPGYVRVTAAPPAVMRRVAAEIVAVRAGRP